MGPARHSSVRRAVLPGMNCIIHRKVCVDVGLLLNIFYYYKLYASLSRNQTDSIREGLADRNGIYS